MKESPPGFEQKLPLQEQEISVEAAEQMMCERILERLHERAPMLYTSFALPIDQQGSPVFFERKNDPHKGLFSIVGGKIDYSGLTQTQARSESSTYFKDQGFESPTDAVLRELGEELYPDILKRSDGIEFLEQKLQPVRHAFVYDAVHNALNTLYTVQMDPELVLQPLEEELGAMRSLAELRPEEINPLSHFLLKLLNREANLPKELSWGRIEHIPLPQDVLKASVKPQNFELSYTPKTPSYLINY